MFDHFCINLEINNTTTFICNIRLHSESDDDCNSHPKLGHLNCSSESERKLRPSHCLLRNAAYESHLQVS